MTYEEFQHLARLYVVGALDEEEREQFRAGRMVFGPRAEAFIRECRKLNAAFALSLRPMAPRPETKQKLMERIRATPSPRAETPLAHIPAVEFESPAMGRRLLGKN